MIEYIYFVKCPNCEDEHFDFFDEAKAFALGCLSQKPIITQIEVDRNDFGECTDSTDLGTIWSWEDECKECGPDAEKAGSHILTKADLENVPEHDPEFDELDNSVEVEDDDFRAVNELAEALRESIAFKDIKDFEEFARLCREIGLKTLGDVEYFAEVERVPAGQLMDKLREYRDELGPDFKLKECKGKPVPEGMTIEQLVEEMEENEDMVECTWCNDLFPKDECRKEVDLGYLCSRCEAAIKSRGEKLTFVENDYWDFLDEEYYGAPKDLAFYVDEAIHHLIYDLGRDSTAEDFGDEVIGVVERWYDTELDIPEDPQRYAQWCSAILCEVSRQLTTNPKYAELNETASHDPLDHHDPEYTEDEAADYLADIADSAKDKMYDDALDALNEENETSEISVEEDVKTSNGLSTCPECGAEKSFDQESGVCNNCGFML